MHQKRDLCPPQEAAKRLGISIGEVLDLISTGELAAVTYMDDDRWFVELDSLDGVARRARGQEARHGGWARRRADFLHLI